MTKDEEIQDGLKAYAEALRFAAVAATREDLAGVEERYWIAFNRLRESSLEAHRLTCAQCLEAVARMLDSEGRRAAGNDLRAQAEAFRKPPR